MSQAADITRRAKSNLAFALRILPRERREDMTVFYAFCRSVDDLADDDTRPVPERKQALEEWKRGIASGFLNATELQQALVSLRDRHRIPVHWLTAVVEGCEEDLSPRTFPNWDQLDSYIWKVAGAVGLVSTRLFGCKDPSSESYAEHLGRALQITNIIRDVSEDLSRGRVYLPADELARHGLDATTLRSSPPDGRVKAVLASAADRAEASFASAAAACPPGDRGALLPARIMAEIYQHLLSKMRCDGFRVFSTRYKVSSARKLWILGKLMIADRLSAR